MAIRRFVGTLGNHLRRDIRTGAVGDSEVGERGYLEVPNQYSTSEGVVAYYDDGSGRAKK